MLILKHEEINYFSKIGNLRFIARVLTSFAKPCQATAGYSAFKA